jgi:hypothetical protein
MVVWAACDAPTPGLAGSRILGDLRLTGGPLPDSEGDFLWWSVSQAKATSTVPDIACRNFFGIAQGLAPYYSPVPVFSETLQPSF